jgi:serine/threonine protein kinase
MPPRQNFDRTRAPFTPAAITGKQRSTHKDWLQASGKHDTGKVARILKYVPWGNKKTHAFGQTIDFLFSAHDFDNGTEPDPAHGWYPVRLLGQGGFGSVGLWKKSDEKGINIDEIAIKDQAHDIPHQNAYMYPETMSMRAHGIPEEVVFQAGLQVKEAQALARRPPGHDDTAIDRNPHVAPLRSYKWNERQGRSRMYALYARWGTLWDLCMLYRAYGQPIPQPFVWAVLHSLLLILKQHQGPLPDNSVLYQYRQRRRTHEDYFVHMDLKEENILLDYSPMSDEELDALWSSRTKTPDLMVTYPIVLVTDYGLALDQPDLIPEQWGTAGYMPPEQIGWGSEFWHPPNNPRPRTDVKHDIWSIGKIILEMMLVTNTEWNPDTLKVKREDCQERQYHDNNEHFLIWIEFLKECRKDYEEPLVRLVYDCLRPSAKDRIDLDSLLAETSKATRLAAEPQFEHRLFFRDADIGLIPRNPTVKYPLLSLDNLSGIQFRNPEVAIDLPGFLWGKCRRDLPRYGPVPDGEGVVDFGDPGTPPPRQPSDDDENGGPLGRGQQGVQQPQPIQPKAPHSSQEMMNPNDINQQGVWYDAHGNPAPHQQLFPHAPPMQPPAQYFDPNRYRPQGGPNYQGPYAPQYPQQGNQNLQGPYAPQYPQQGNLDLPVPYAPQYLQGGAPGYQPQQAVFPPLPAAAPNRPDWYGRWGGGGPANVPGQAANAPAYAPAQAPAHAPANAQAQARAQAQAAARAPAHAAAHAAANDPPNPPARRRANPPPNAPDQAQAQAPARMRAGAPANDPANPANPPPPAPANNARNPAASIPSDDGELVALVNEGMEAIRKRARAINDRDPANRIICSGRGRTKKVIAKEVLRRERRDR